MLIYYRDNNNSFMKKILIITLMVICMIFNITACGVKSNNTSKSPLRQTKDMAENVYDAIKNSRIFLSRTR